MPAAGRHQAAQTGVLAAWETRDQVYYTLIDPTTARSRVSGQP
jgi:hypothetical protein